MSEDNRPETWDEYVGQVNMKTRLQIRIDAARKTGKALDHVLLCGPPGMGKTTIANLIADKMVVDLYSTIMPINPRMLQRLVMSHHGVLFLDEIHRAPVKQQEELLPLLEDGYLMRPNGQKIYSTYLTIIGATTEPEGLIKPLYDRFKIRPLFESYTPEEMMEMVTGMAARVGVSLSEEILAGIARASVGVPRNARSLVDSAAALIHIGREPSVDDVLELAGITSDGLSEQHVEYLKALDVLGGRAGLAILSTMLRLHPKVINDLERVLVTKQLIEFTTGGREMTGPGYDLIHPKEQ